jgi:hypothetical protein
MTANTSCEEILQEHLRYDVDMLEGTFRLLNEPTGDLIVGNALIESFCIHARGLIEFLSNRNRASWRQHSQTTSTSLSEQEGCRVR